MKRLSTFLSSVHAPALLVAMATIGLTLLAFWPTFAGVLDHRNQARDAFEEMRRAVRETEQAKTVLQTQVDSLRTHVDAVRLQARNEFRLTMPGERIEVFELPDSALTAGQLHANRFQ